MSTCDVCCEKFNLSTRRKVVCSYCPFNFCRSCCSEYVLSMPNDPQCMNCKKPWSREFLSDSFTQVWMNTAYRSKRESLLFERERGLMPATQPYVEREAKKRVELRLIDKYSKEKFKLNNEYEDIRKRKYSDQIEKFAILEEIMGRVRILDNRVTWCHNRIDHYTSNESKVEKKHFVRCCPADECRGFLSTAWKCGICEIWVCPECHEIKGLERDAEHTCKPENVETARMLAKDSKPCPSCSAMIFKINGCDQMYCTQCNTAFSWNTGRIEKGRVHNPHYFEYLRQRGGEVNREIGDIPCGGIPDPRHFMNRVRCGFVINPDTDPVVRSVMDCIQSASHIENVTLYRYRVNAVEDNQDLRIKYMLNDYNEDEFKKQLQSREHWTERRGSIAAVLNTYLIVVSQTIRNFITTAPGPEDPHTLNNVLIELHEIRNFTNEAMLKVSKTYKKCAVPKISAHRFTCD